MKNRIWLWLGLVLTTGLICGGFLLAQAVGGVAVNVKPNTDGTSTVSFQGAAGKTYRVESSDDMAIWQAVSPNLPSTGAVTEWVDMRPARGTQRFYRVSSQSVEAGAPPVSTEAQEGRDLLAALSGDDHATALDILRRNGVAENTLTVMAARLGQPPARVPLAEPFLKAVVSLSLAGRTADVQDRVQAATARGYGRPCWVARWLDTNWTARCDAELAQSPVPPIGVLNVQLGDPSFIEFFKWYDRYAERLHSVVVNGEDLSNHELKGNYAAANEVMSGLYKLIKARKPDAFVWVSVVRKDDGSDGPWLQALTFKPDGLQISNLREFHSQCEKTRDRYFQLVGADTALMVAGFYGYKAPLWRAGQALSAAKKIPDLPQRQAAKAAALQKLGEIGKVIRPELGQQEQYLAQQGFRGLSAHWLLVLALEEAGK